MIHLLSYKFVAILPSAVDAIFSVINGLLSFNELKKSVKSSRLKFLFDTGNRINLERNLYQDLKLFKNNNFKFFKCDISSWKESEKVFKKLDKKMPGWRNKIIKANFICALTIYWPSGKYKTSIGKRNQIQLMRNHNHPHHLM